MRRAAVVVVAGLLGLTGAASAGASEADTAPRGLAVEAVSARSTGTDALCETARQLDGARGQCAVATTSQSSAGTRVDLASAAAAGDLDLVSSEGQTLRSAVAAGTVWTRTWWQEKRGLYYVNWLEKHTGRIYYDGSQVWSTSSYRGYKGTHVCDQGYGILYDIKVNSCSTERIGTATLKEWDYFRVHVVWKGIPLYASHNMHMTANRSGTITF
jgi:hypothetical protein